MNQRVKEIKVEVFSNFYPRLHDKNLIKQTSILLIYKLVFKETFGNKNFIIFQ
jgi:hypothetical protein